MITTFYPPYSFGGDGIFVRNLANELSARGHRVDVIHCRDSFRALARGAPAEPYSDGSGITVHGLESPVGPLSPLATQQTGRPLFKTRQIKKILDQGFDVIHYHNLSLIGGPKLLEYGSAVKLYTFHEYWLVCPTHLLFRFNRAPCERRLCNLCVLAHGRPPQLWRAGSLLERSLRHVDLFLSPSRFGMATHLRLGLKIPIAHLPSFVPAAETRSAQRPADPYFLYVGRLEHPKGPQTLIEPFRRWDKARLVIAGSGGLAPQLRRLAGTSGQIELLGRVSGDELRALYRGATALIVPSLTFEMFPLVILEAFREATPVVVRARGALPELVEDSGGGLIYDGDHELTPQLDKLFADRSLRDELGRRGRARYQTDWSSEAHIDRYLGLIGNLVANRPPAGQQP